MLSQSHVLSVRGTGAVWGRALEVAFGCLVGVDGAAQGLDQVQMRVFVDEIMEGFLMIGRGTSGVQL